MIASWEQWQRPLTEALLHFLWQGVLIAFLAGGLFHLLAARSPEVRYGVGMIGLLAMAGCPLVTFYVLMPNHSHGAAPPEPGIVFTDSPEHTALAPAVMHVPAPPSAAVPVEPTNSGSYSAWIVFRQAR